MPLTCRTLPSAASVEPIHKDLPLSHRIWNVAQMQLEQLWGMRKTHTYRCGST